MHKMAYGFLKLGLQWKRRSDTTFGDKLREDKCKGSSDQENMSRLAAEHALGPRYFMNHHVRHGMVYVN